MRYAALQDALRHITENNETWPVRIERLVFEGIPGIGSGEVTFTSPLSVITGQNSIGKTTLLRSIWMGLDAARATQSGLTNRKVSTGRVQIEGVRFGTTFNRVVFIDQSATYCESKDLDVLHLDSAEAIGDLQEKMYSLGGSSEIVNGAPDRLLDDNELREVSFLTHRDYSSVRVFEVEIELGQIAPFFEASHGGMTYDSTHMGSGEYAALYVWWILKNAPNGAILLMEEPETFLSSWNQESLLQYLVSIIDKKKLAAVVTTHSGHLLHWLPKQSVKFLRRSGGNCTFVKDPHPTSLEAIGIYLKPDIFVYVEDKAAQIVARNLIERFDPVFARRCQIEEVGGEAVITKALTSSADNPFGLRFIGWYDGDQEGKIPKKVLRHSAILPGSEAIEIVLRKFVTAAPVEAERAFGNSKLSEIIENLEGQNYHEWSHRLSKALGRDHESVLSTLLEMWLNHAPNLESAEQRYAAFRRIAET